MKKPTALNFASKFMCAFDIILITISIPAGELMSTEIDSSDAVIARYIRHIHSHGRYIYVPGHKYIRLHYALHRRRHGRNVIITMHNLLAALISPR